MSEYQQQLAGQKILSWCLVAALVGTALSVVTVRQLNRASFYQAQKLQHQRDDLSIEWRQLMAEYSTWRLEHKIENEVRGNAGLNPPQSAEIKTIKLAPRFKP